MSAPSIEDVIGAHIEHMQGYTLPALAPGFIDGYTNALRLLMRDRGFLADAIRREALPALLAGAKVEALREVVALRREWRARMDAEDEAQYAGGSFHGAGPDGCADVMEAWLDERADEIEADA